MKNHFPSIAKLVAVAACALTLGSCNRAEYAMLPKGSSYHGVTRVATPVPANPEAVAPAKAPLAEVSATVASAPVATETAPATASAPKAAPAPKATAMPQPQPATAQSAATTVVAPAPKLNLVQRLALNKVTRKMDKLMQKSGVMRQHDNMASTARSGIDGNLRIGLILLLIGVLIGLINNLVGGIIIIVGLVFIVLWLLDQL